MEILNIKNLSFTYPEQKEKALNNISFSVNGGDFVVICGESGCGKTTLLKLIKKELAPKGTLSGEILYNGVPTADLDERVSASEIGYVTQNPEMQIVTDKVWHELAFGLENMGEPTGSIRRRVAEMASFFGISDWFRKKTCDLSGGQKQLLNLASIMVTQPKILILDEPTSQLDPIAAADFIATLQKLNKELGLTVLLVEHRLEEVFPAADKAAVLDKGELILYNSPKNVGKELKSIGKEHPMLLGLPSGVRIFNMLDIDGECPLTVKEGRRFLTKHFSAAKVKALPPRAETNVAQPTVEACDIWFRYERNLPDVLRGLSVSAYPGEILGILGGNGTGKTTALGVISGQNKAYRGNVIINGKKIGKYSGAELYRNNIAYLPQNPQTVFLKSTVSEDYGEVAKAMGYGKAEKAELIEKITDELGISSLIGRHPYDLSGGEQQKAALAKILLLKPKILLLDEPTKGIDAYSKYKFGKILKNLKERGLTVIMVTHDVEFAAENADKCAMLFDGEIISADRPEIFFSDNSFYTTAASRISRHIYKNAVVCETVAQLCKANMG
jgi:energy-coupling factor transport system ATP-binding protein